VARVELSRQAQEDFEAAADWYTGSGAYVAADDLADEIGHALHLLAQFPELGKPGKLSTRTFALHDFPYSLIYRITGDSVRVIAVAHHNRRPVYWRGRR